MIAKWLIVNWKAYNFKNHVLDYLLHFLPLVCIWTHSFTAQFYPLTLKIKVQIYSTLINHILIRSLKDVWFHSLKYIYRSAAGEIYIYSVPKKRLVCSFVKATVINCSQIVGQSLLSCTNFQFKLPYLNYKEGTFKTWNNRNYILNDSAEILGIY
jgi:hypothetical protein